MFFVYETQLSHAAGFSLYGLPHLCTLAGIFLSCLIGARWYKRQPDSTRHSFSHALGLTIFLLDILRYVVYWRIGGLSIYELPLHLCGLAVYLCILHSIWKPDWLGQVLYTLCLPGACCALLFPDWTHYPFWSFVSLHSFLAHGLLVFYIVLQTASGEILPRLSAIWKPILFLCAVVPPIYWFNTQWHTNYMFLQLPSPDSPLELLACWAHGSHALYLVLFAGIIFLIMLGMNGLYSKIQHHKKLPPNGTI